MLQINPPEPECLSIDGWEQWEREASKSSPVAWFVRKTVPRWFSRTWRGYVHDPWYWLKCRIWHRHNVVVIRSLPPTWTDRDERILHAVFQLLVDFVEREEHPRGEWSHLNRTREQLVEAYNTAYEECDPEIAAGILKTAEKRADDWLEIKALYEWWTVERPARKEAPVGPDGYDSEWGRASNELDAQRDDEDDAMLHRLIDVRGYLWS